MQATKSKFPTRVNVRTNYTPPLQGSELKTSEDSREDFVTVELQRARPEGRGKTERENIRLFNREEWRITAIAFKTTVVIPAIPVGVYLLATFGRSEQPLTSTRHP